jgi:hypothetical protein
VPLVVRYGTGHEGGGLERKRRTHRKENPVPNDPNPKAYPAEVSELSAKVPGKVGDAERVFFAAQISEAAARDEGAEWQSTVVLDGAIGVLRTLLPFVLEGKVPGYGPLRLRYQLDLCGDLAADVATFDSAVVGAAGASAKKTTSLRGSRDDRRVALRVLKALAGDDPAAKARLKAATKDAEQPDERARSLERIAQELESAIAKVPPAVAADAGATPELVASLRAFATGVLGARGKAQDARSEVASLYDKMNVLDARIIKEVRLLCGSASDARKTNKAIPAVRNPFRRGKKAKGEPGAPPGGGTPDGEGTPK